MTAVVKSADADGLDLPPLRGYRSLREEVANALRAALVAGQMRPGTVYSAPALAARFDVSATPVREAMLDLAKEGLVEVVRNKGFRVTVLSDADLDEITELRELIEVPTVVKLVPHVDSEAFVRLRPLAQQIVDAAREGDVIGYVEADRRFHLDLLALADNTRLVETVSDLRKRSRLYGLTQLKAERLLASAEEHLKLLDLLEAGDAEAVGFLMRQHLRHVRGSWAGRPESVRT
ncbi:GntR family transcriptional regulator [Actinopolymorpha sp. B11F2]|uniref:GntR family transcriptional regulator n=1 Tax=Actinopolymorpha sp. B11F2 TaxID=3160862 RepID=UPI0032E3BDEF